MIDKNKSGIVVFKNDLCIEIISKNT